MLRILRQLRHSLMEHLPAGQAGKNVRSYLFYAIGEILLVVIGILIALQVNNWNEARKMDEQGEAYLHRLLDDLTSDQLYFDEQVKQADSVMIKGRIFITEMHQDQQNLEDVLQLMANFRPRTERKIIQTSTYDEMRSSGNLGLIRNDSLRQAIVNFYRNTAHRIRMMDDYHDYTGALIANAGDFNLWKLTIPWSERDLFVNRELYDDSDWQFMNAPSSTLFKQVENIVTQYVGKHRQEKDLIQQILGESSLMIAAINDELKR